MNICSLYLQRTNDYIMSPRARRIRKLLNPPLIKGFKPYGHADGTESEGIVTMLYEEYESLKLCDYDMMTHHSASELMGVSRPTFTRIYSSARQKIALALAEGLKLTIEGGKVCFDSDWFLCGNCGSYFNNPDKETRPKECALCGSVNISETHDSFPENHKNDINDECICTECGYISAHTRKKPCQQEICPSCKKPMRRRHSNK